MAWINLKIRNSGQSVCFMFCAWNKKWKWWFCEKRICTKIVTENRVHDFLSSVLNSMRLRHATMFYPSLYPEEFRTVRNCEDRMKIAFWHETPCNTCFCRVKNDVWSMRIKRRSRRQRENRATRLSVTAESTRVLVYPSHLLTPLSVCYNSSERRRSGKGARDPKKLPI